MVMARSTRRQVTERDIQRVLYGYRANIAAAPIMVPNIYLWPWESDLIYISRSNYTTEFEIKLTHADFMNDTRSRVKKMRQRALEAKEKNCPAEFYYVCPEGIIKPEEVPDYAGLMYVVPITKNACYWDFCHTGYCIKVIIRAPKRKNKLKDHQVLGVLQKGINRYWSLHEHMVNKGE